MAQSFYLTFLLALLALPIVASTKRASISVNVPATAPSNSVDVSATLLAFSIEGDEWPKWAANAPNFNSRNEFFFNALKNLHDRTGSWPNIRVGANSEDRTAFDTKIKFITESFAPPTSTLPYPEGSGITVGPSFYSLSQFLPSGTDMTWGFNFGAENLTLATIELKAILNAFNTNTSQGGVKGSGVNLKFVELGNEPDLFGNNGHRSKSWNVAAYVTEWRSYIQSLLNTTSLGSGNPKIQAMSFANSDFGKGGFSPQQAIKDGILSGNIAQHVGVISQHHYSGGCCSARIQDLMNKGLIRNNLTQFEGDIAAVKSTGIPFIFGETNTYFNHGVPDISDAGGAAIWITDYTLFAATIGIGQMFFHEGVGYKYNLIQPVTLTVSPDDGTTLNPSEPAHVQAPYYGGLVINEFLGTSSNRKIVELDFSSEANLSGFALYSNGNLQRVVLINHDPFLSTQKGTRPSLSVSLSSLGTKTVTLKTLSIPFADHQTGLTWAGQSFDGGIPSGQVRTTTQSTSQPIVVNSTSIVLVQF